MARGRCGSLDLHRRRLPLPTPCQSPGKSGRSVSAAVSPACHSVEGVVCWDAALRYPRPQSDGSGADECGACGLSGAWEGRATRAFLVPLRTV